MRHLFVLIFLLVVSSAGVAASPFDGEWSVEWSCKGAIGVYAERCAEGARDSFTLDLWTSGLAICGLHLATAQLGNRVDEGDLLDGNPTILGTFNDTSATVKFRSAWGATGTADVQVKGKKLYWTIRDQSQGESWLPPQAVLIKQRAATEKDLKRKCDAV